MEFTQQMDEKSLFEIRHDPGKSDEDILKSIFENSPHAMAIIDMQGFIINTNRKWLEIFGYSRDEMNGIHILDMMPHENYLLSLKMIKSFFSMTSGVRHHEGIFLKRDGSRIWIDVTIQLITETVTGSISSIVLYADNNSLDSITKTHRSSEIKSHVLLEESPIGIVVYRKRKLLFANKAYARIFGYSRPELMIGISGFMHVSEHERNSVIERNMKLEDGLIDTDIYDIVCVKNDGSEINVSVNTVRIILGDETATLGFLQNITDRKRIEEDLKKSRDVLEERIAKRTREITMLNQQVINSQELERQRIAKDLHDGVGQSILAAKVNFSIFKNNHELYHDRLDRGLLLIDQSVRELREICSDLFPSALDEFGLASAIRLLAKYSLGSAGITVELNLDSDLKIKKETEINLYRIVQESFSNILKHSGADSVKISLEKHNDSVRLYIEDNGTGFDPAKVIHSHNHCGLISIKQRTEGLGGIVIIDSAINMGTKLIVILG